VAECSDLVALGDPRDNTTLWAMHYSRMMAVCPETGRKNLSPLIVGHFDGRVFEPIFEQELDFGTSAYAFQVGLIFFLVQDGLFFFNF
jgi:beta-fructofuranosidase